MATNKHKAKRYIEEMSKASAKLMSDLKIEREDVDLDISIYIEDVVSYNSKNDTEEVPS